MSDNRNDLPAPSAPNFNQRLRETVQTFLGRQGNPLDRVLTLRDLVDIGMLKLRSGFQLKPGAGSSVPLEPGDGVVDTYEPDLTPPPTPGSMTVTASISHVMIEHEAPLYRQGHGHLRTRVYGKVVKAGDPLPTFADAAEIGQFSGTIYAHPSNPATTWRLWIKWETMDGVLSADPAGGINGLEAITGQDVALLLDALNGQIKASNLHADLTSRIDLIDGPATLNGSISQRIASEQTARANEIQAERQARAAALLAEAQARGTAISSETQARVTADSALQSQINMLSAAGSGDFSQLLAAIQEEQTARIEGDTAEATQRTTLAAQVTELVAVDEYDALERDILGHGLNVLNTAERIRSTASLTEEQTVRATQDEALAQRITTLSATVAQNTASLTAEQAARATADEALSSNLLSLQAKVNTNTASITAEQTARASADSAMASSINYLQAQVNSNAASITNEATARSTADASLSSQIDTLTAKVNTADANLSAAIQNEATARANADTAEAQARETLAARVAGTEGSIASQAVQINNRYTKAETDSAISSSSQALSAAYQAADAATLESAKGYTNAGILSEQTARANADSALATDITNLGATVNTNNTTLSAAILSEAQARADSDAAVARSVTTLQASAGTGGLVYNGAFANGSTEGWSGLYSVTNAPYGGLPKAYAGIQTGRDIFFPNADPSQWMACRPGDEFEVSAWVSAQAANPRYSIGIQYERTNGNTETWTHVDSTTAPTTAKFLRGYWTAPSDARRVRFWGQIDTFGTENPWHITDVQLRRTDARTSSNTAAIQVEAEARATQTGELYAKYGVKLDVNGYVTGWAMNNDGATGDMIVLADRFAVGAPGGGDIIPFVVNTTEQTINGVKVPAGTYMDAAYIKNGTITNAKIGNASIDDAKISSLSAEKITTGTLDAARISANSISAEKIDARGLSIKDADGNVILAAGSALNWSMVGGAGKPADGATAGSNLVIKSTFSDGNAGSWNANAVNATAHGGVGEIQCVSRDTLETGNDFAVTPGETLFYAADIWTGGSSYPATAGVMISNSAGVVIAYQGASALPAGQDWTRVTGHGVMPTGAVNATPWVQIDGPGGQVLPYVAFSKIYVGRQQEGATVGANSSNLTIGVGVNLLPNSNFLNGSLEGWGKGDGWPNNEWGTGLAGWDLDGNESTAYLHQTTGYVDNWTGDLYATRVPVVAGTRYEAYAYTGSHRALLQVLVAWYNSSGTYLGENGVGTNDEEVGGGTALSGYKKTGGFALAPAGAATAMFFIRKHSTKNGYGDSWAFISRAFFGEALPGQTELSPWSPGSVQGVRALGYSGALDATKGATFGVDIEGKINPTNVTTFIDNGAINTAQIADLAVGSAKIATAAITTAKIGNLQVDTVNIKGFAVTNPVSAYTEITELINDANHIVQSVAIVSSGNPIIIQATSDFSPTAGSTQLIWQLTRYEGGIGTYLTSHYREAQYGIVRGMTVSYVDTPPAGTYTYILETWPQTDGASAYVSRRFLLAMEVKK